jgi:carbonic anhydrase
MRSREANILDTSIPMNQRRYTVSTHTILSRRDFLRVGGLVVLSVTTAACAPATEPTVQSEGPASNADEALQRLVDGNKRYSTNKSINLNETESRRVEVASGQKPFATIFSCIDSRVPPELIFDRGLGDLFVIRTAGQVLDSAVLGSLEFTVAEVHVPLVMVLGHENCGAVKATVETLEANATAEADINYLVEGIRPAVEKAHGQPGDEIDNVVRANVELMVERLKESPILSEALEKGELKIVGARYDLDTGVVEMIA